MGECGLPTNGKDWDGKDLFVGDIVYLFHNEPYKVGDEKFDNYIPHGLTAIVSCTFESYQDGTVKLTGDDEPFVMGIKSSGLGGKEWVVKKVKGWENVIEGEKWTEYGFNYEIKELNFSEASCL